MSTKTNLAYKPGTSACMLYSPGDGSLRIFDRMFGHAWTVGSCCHKSYKKMGAALYWFVHFHHAVVRDKVDPHALNEVLMEIPEFRRHCAEDIPCMNKYEDEYE